MLVLVPRLSRSIAALALALAPTLVGLGCAPPLPAGPLPCQHARDCSSGRCMDGRCVRPVEADAGDISDGGTMDSGVDASVPADGGANDAGVDASVPGDGGTSDAGIDASVPGDGGTSDGGGGGTDSGGEGCPAGCAPPFARAPIEICGDGFDNDCDGIVDEQPCGEMRTIALASDAPVPAGYSIALPVADLFVDPDGGGVELARGDDVRVWLVEPSGTFTELHRVLDPDEDWSVATTLWVALPEAHGGPPAPGRLRLTWGALPDGAAPPLADEREVFHFADFFDDVGPNGSPGWVFDEDPGDGHDWNIRDGALILDSVANDQNGYPRATHDFAPLSGGFVIDLGFHWSGEDDDNDYAWRFLVGNEAMPTPPSNKDATRTGVGPNLIWGYGDSEFDLSSRQSLAVDEQAQQKPTVLATGVNQRTRVRLVGDTGGPTPSFRAVLNGAESLEQRFLDDNVVSFSRVRLYPSEMETHDNDDDEQFPHRRFEHIIIRPALPVEPTVTLHAPPTCP